MIYFQSVTELYRLHVYNSNKIEDSTLTEEQTASLFDNGTLPKSDDN